MKIASTVGSLDCDITIIGRKSGDCCNTDSVPFRTKRFKMFFKKGFLFYGFFNFRLFFHLLFSNYDILVANDLDTLLPNFLISRLKQLHLVYDSHEYFTEVPEIQNRRLVKGVWKSIENFIFPRLKHVMTVSEPIASLYEELYHIRPLVVKNFSRKSGHIIPYSRKELNVNMGDLLVIIQGNGINIDKGAEELVEAMNKLDGVILFIVGSGDVVPNLKQMVTGFKIGYKVKFIKSLPWDILMRYTKAADIGMSIEKDTNLNYRYSLSNKLFDYISAGIAVVASELSETGKILRENQCGMIIDKVTPEKIAGALTKLKNNPVELAKLKKNTVIASEKLNWENESLKVEGFYRSILNK
jgi:glycosyltransferase involved in cell wall biosynthesis